MQEITNFNIEKTTAEILMLKDQTAQNIIEIGKRLIEAKDNLQHGEYLEWLKVKVQFTERTAQRFMQIGKEFSNTTSLSHLGSTKLFLLAGLDEEDRQEVMQENNMEDMTTRELEQAVKEKKEIKKQLEAEQEYSQELQDAIREKEQHGENKLAYVQVEGINFENYTLITNFYGMLPFGGVIMQKILVVEDDLDIQELLKNFLQEVGYEIILASDGVEALSVFSASQFDLVLLDVMLPKIDGFAVCEFIRKQSQVPIIMLTALSGEEEQIRGLDLQVDDYITKPFSMPILIRKIAAVLRRSSGPQEDEHKTIAFQNLILDCDNYTATVDGAAYELTQREFEVLKELLTNQGRILTRQNLLDKLWRYDFYGDERVVDTHIKNLRKKLGIDFIQTIRGVGYKIDKKN